MPDHANDESEEYLVVGKVRGPSMPYVRISVVRPRRGKEEAVREVIDQLVAHYGRQPGCVGGYRLEHADGSSRFGRIGIWQTEDDAERAAQTEHDLALRAELNALVDEASHEEYSFDGTPAAVQST